MGSLPVLNSVVTSSTPTQPSSGRTPLVLPKCCMQGSDTAGRNWHWHACAVKDQPRSTGACETLAEPFAHPPTMAQEDWCRVAISCVTCGTGSWAHGSQPTWVVLINWGLSGLGLDRHGRSRYHWNVPANRKVLLYRTFRRISKLQRIKPGPRSNVVLGGCVPPQPPRTPLSSDKSAT